MLLNMQIWTYVIIDEASFAYKKRIFKKLLMTETGICSAM